MHHILVEANMKEQAEREGEGRYAAKETATDTAVGSTEPPPGLPCRYTLANGQMVELDYLGRSDRDDFLAGFQGLSARSRYLRFFSAMPELPAFIIEGLLNTDAVNHVAICARLIGADGRRLAPVVGVARYFRSSDSETTAEPAIAVADELHRLGLGKYLLRRLSAIARSQGVTHFRAQVLPGNERMLDMLREANANIVDKGTDVVTYEIDIRKTTPAPRGVLKRLLAVMQGARPH